MVPVGSGEVGEGVVVVAVAETPGPEYPRFAAATGVPAAAAAAAGASAIIPFGDEDLQTGVLTVQLDRWVPQRPHRAVTYRLTFLTGTFSAATAVAEPGADANSVAVLAEAPLDDTEAEPAAVAAVSLPVVAPPAVSPADA